MAKKLGWGDLQNSLPSLNLPTRQGSETEKKRNSKTQNVNWYQVL